MSAAGGSGGGALAGRRVAVLATDGVELVELDEPVEALRAAGARVELLAPEEGAIRGVNGMDPGREVKVDHRVGGVSPFDYDALVLPGGVANPDRLRMDPDSVRFTREMMEADRPVAAICHGPWLLVEAGMVRGRTLTSYPSLQTDIRNAGGEWVDREVVQDQKLITSRRPDDLPAFCDRLVQLIAAASDESALDSTVEQSFPASDPAPPPTALSGSGTSGGQQPEERREGGDARPDGT